MTRRLLRDEADARECLAAVQRSGLSFAAWGRAAGVDARSLHAWSMNLGRREGGPRRKQATSAPLTKRVELVELIATPSPPSRTAVRYTVRVGKLGIEVGDDFDGATLRRIVAVLATC